MTFIFSGLLITKYYNSAHQQATRTAQDRATWRRIIKELLLCASQALPRQ